jgi:hypothetical protein
MSDVPEFSKRAVFLGRLSFAALGGLLILVGVMMFLYLNAPANWLGILSILVGLAGLVYSMSMPGKNVANSAKTLVESFDE